MFSIVSKYGTCLGLERIVGLGAYLFIIWTGCSFRFCCLNVCNNVGFRPKSVSRRWCINNYWKLFYSTEICDTSKGVILYTGSTHIFKGHSVSSAKSSFVRSSRLFIRDRKTRLHLFSDKNDIEGRSRSTAMEQFNNHFLSVICSSHMSILYRFWDIQRLIRACIEIWVGVIQGHWKWYHSIDHIGVRLPVGLPLYRCRDIWCWRISWPWIG